MRRRSSARSRSAQRWVKASTEAGSRSRRDGRSAESPRRPNGSSRGLSVQRVDSRGRAGKTCDRSPAARPGTSTAAHCKPLDVCTVASLTESVSTDPAGLQAELSVSAALR